MPMIPMLSHKISYFVYTEPVRPLIKQYCVDQRDGLEYSAED